MRDRVTQGLSLPSVTSGLLLYPVFSQSPSHSSPPSIHLIFLSSLPASALGLSGRIIWHLVGTFYPERLAEVDTTFCLTSQASKVFNLAASIYTVILVELFQAPRVGAAKEQWRYLTALRISLITSASASNPLIISQCMVCVYTCVNNGLLSA